MNAPEVRVLDDIGYVRLVHAMGSDVDIVRAARVSFDADWRAGVDEGSDEKLIKYLMKNRHSTPFEAVVFSFEICCPIFIARQWHRHRTWSYNEISARYAKLDIGYYYPKMDTIGKQSKDNKQARVIGEELTPEETAGRQMYIDHLKACCYHAEECYAISLDLGIPRELARLFLPVNAYTRYFGTVNLWNLFHFIGLREHGHAQYEMREYALALSTLASAVVPVAFRAYRQLQSAT